LGVGNGVNMFIRTLTASLAAAIAGAVFASQLSQELAARVPSGSIDTGTDLTALVREPDEVRKLAPAVSNAVIESIAEAVNRAFLWLVPVAIVGVVVTMVMRAPQLVDQPEDAEVTHAGV
jgi:hypothetical protein